MRIRDGKNPDPQHWCKQTCLLGPFKNRTLNLALTRLGVYYASVIIRLCGLLELDYRIL